jgi:dimethylaniline monooxygenase (N-oxide forming)
VFPVPVAPHFPGIETFSGTLLHSREYTVPEPFAGQTVVVVGAGSSGNDIAIELSQVAREVILSARSVDWAAALNRSARARMPDRILKVRQVLTRAATRLRRHTTLMWRNTMHARQGDGPDAPFELGSVPPTLKPVLLERIRAGTVLPRPQIVATEGSWVVFGDGSRVQANTIIAATGYAVDFPFLDAEIIPVSRAGLPLYRLVFPPDYPTLAFIGMFRVTGPVPPVAEMQARWVARIWRGDVALPAPDEMRAAIAARMALIARTGSNPFRLDFEAYLDLLAADIGALPRLWRHPRLWHALLFGPAIAAQYRLDGSNHRQRMAHGMLVTSRAGSQR